MPPRSTRPRRGSTGRSPAQRDRTPGSRVQAYAGRMVRSERASGSSCSRPSIAGSIGQAGRGARRRAYDCGWERLRSARSWSSAPDALPMTPERTAARLRDPQGHDPAVTRWRLTIEYDGGPFMGWQRQDHGPSVQQALEEALAAHDRRACGIHCRGADRRRSPRARHGRACRRHASRSLRTGCAKA